jgi:hypothetical protein
VVSKQRANFFGHKVDIQKAESWQIYFKSGTTCQFIAVYRQGVAAICS